MTVVAVVGEGAGGQVRRVVCDCKDVDLVLLMTRQEIQAIVERFASLAAEIHCADPADKAEIYMGINLVPTSPTGG